MKYSRSSIYFLLLLIEQKKASEISVFSRLLTALLGWSRHTAEALLRDSITVRFE